jgi:hypothetical protein
MSMDSEAKDFVIDGEGNLMPVDEETEVSVLQGDTATVLAVVIRNGSGEVTVQLFGPASHEMMTALHVAIQGVMSLVLEEQPIEKPL